jgi:hypothetical protein
MSIRYTAYTVIGQRVDSESNLKHTKERGCKHSAAAGHKFCPECGAETWIGTDLNIIDPYEDYEGIKIITPGYENHSEFFVCGYVVSVDDDDAKSFELCDFTPADLSAARAAVRAFLFTPGLWRESQFGVYTIISAH